MTQQTDRGRLDDGLRGWIIRKARRDYWKVAGYCDLDDLIQEGFVCYAKCHDRYPEGLAQRHFMALVQRTFENHIRTLSAKRHRKVDWPVDLRDSVENPDTRLTKLGGSEPEEQTFAAMLASLPDDLKLLIKVLLEDAKNIPMLTGKDRRTPGGRFRKAERETWNEYFCRLIGEDPKSMDIEARLRAHFAA